MRGRQGAEDGHAAVVVLVLVKVGVDCEDFVPLSHALQSVAFGLQGSMASRHLRVKCR